MHNKSIVVLIGVVLSLLAWYSFNLVLSWLYKNNTVYNVKGGLLDRFGDNALWWLILILAVTACIIFELGVAALRAAWFPTDVSPRL
jgi:phospholipid-translocating ATPase